MSTGKPTCEACGYDLTGLTGEGDDARCPECGRQFLPWAPFVPARSPRLVAIVLAMCGPLALLMGIGWGAAWITEAGGGRLPWMVMALAMFTPLWFVASVWLTMGWPIQVYFYLTRGGRYRLSHRKVGAIAAVAVGLNLLAFAQTGLWILTLLFG